MAKKPNRYFAPLVITGIAVGVLAKAYHSIFKKKKIEKSYAATKNLENKNPSEHLNT